MNYGNEDTRYFGGIPSSIISYSTDRGRYQAYDGIYDTTSNTTQQFTTLQNQITTLSNKIGELQVSKSSQSITESPNLIANGDCSQFTLAYPVIGDSGGSGKTYLVIQGRSIPIMDRWYHTAELAGLNPNNLRFECSRVDISSYVGGGPIYGTYPSLTTYGMLCKWRNRTGASAPIFLALEHVSPTNYSKSGGMIAIQHCIPNVKQFVNNTYNLGFWLYSSKATYGYINIMRQYNWNEGVDAAKYDTDASLERIKIETIKLGMGWNYINTTFNVSSLSVSKTIVEDKNGLVIQIGPCYYRWYSPTSYTMYGSADIFLSNSPELQFVFAELQLRSDTIPSKNNFPVNMREEERTLPYVNYCSSLKPTSITASSNPNGIQVLGTGTPYGIGALDPSTTTYAAIIPLLYASRMKACPRFIYYSAIDYSTGSRTIKNFYYDTNQASSDSSSFYTFTIYGSTGMQIDTYCVSGNGSLNTVNANVMPTNSQMISISENKAWFKFSTSVNTGAYVIPTASIFKTASNNTTVWGWFTFIVPESHYGSQNPYAKDFLEYVDYSYTALTSRPFI